MSEKVKKKTELTGRMAGHVIENGLAASGLRALAQAAGTSDRMLLYYFKDKDEILSDVFDLVAQQIEDGLAQAATPELRLPPDALLDLLWEQSRAHEMRLLLTLLLEMSAIGARQGGLYAKAARRIARNFQTWIAERLDVAPDADRQLIAYRIMATLDGMALHDAVGYAPRAPD